MRNLLGLATSALLASLVLLPPQPAPAAPSKSAVIAGSVASSGGVLTAGPNGADYQLPSQALLRLAPGASVRVFPVAQQLQLQPGAKTATYSFALLSGRVDVSVPSKPKSAVLCSIGKLSTVVGTGQATLLARGDVTTVVSVEGDVRTLLDRHWQTLAPGALARFGAEHHGTPEPTIAAPRLATGQRLWFSAGDAIAISGFTFDKVAAAERYELRLRNKDGRHEQLRQVQGATTLTETFTPVGPGEYEIAARSVDREGIQGRWSTSELVRVVGVSLPAGGYASGGDIFIGKGQEVRFSHTEGLEMTYEGAGRYVPASGAVSLYRGELTVVSFRVPGSVFPTSARLRPRSAYAHVTIGPSRAVWPQDPIAIVVELKNKDGQNIPDFVELKPEVTLGIDPLEVAFTREGSRLIGTVPATDKPGPWVLRVEVKDQFGALLGRDFLEIAKAPAAAPSKANAARIARK